MGCDIHAYVEHTWYTNKDGAPAWWPFATLCIDRDYAFFAVLAGVRNCEDAFTPVSAPRGVPKDVAWTAKEAYTLHVSDGPTASHSEGDATKEDAERWLRQGISQWWDSDARWPRITHPDWHSASWLTASELEIADQRYRERYPSGNSQLAAIVAMLKTLENGKPGMARLVFWFDN